MVCNRSISFQSQSLLIHQHFDFKISTHPIKESGVAADALFLCHSSPKFVLGPIFVLR
jgi:hypothetical protein